MKLWPKERCKRGEGRRGSLWWYESEKERNVREVGRWSISLSKSCPKVREVREEGRSTDFLKASPKIRETRDDGR